MSEYNAQNMNDDSQNSATDQMDHHNDDQNYANDYQASGNGGGGGESGNNNGDIQQEANGQQDEQNQEDNGGDGDGDHHGNGDGNGENGSGPNGNESRSKSGGGGGGGANSSGSLEPEQFRKVFIGGLSYKTDDDALKAYFSKYGELVDHVVMKDGQTGRSRGFGFVTYSSSSMVDELMKNRPHIIDGRQVEPKRATPREVKDSGKQEVQMTVKKIFIGGMRDSISDEDLKTYFANYGNIVECLVMRDKETNKSRGFGFITFDDYDPVDKIILEKHHTVNGVTLHIQKALPKDADGNQRQGGGGRSGGYNNRDNQMGGFRNNNFGNMPNQFNGGGFGGPNFGNGGGFGGPMGNRGFGQNGAPHMMGGMGGGMGGMMRPNNMRGGGMGGGGGGGGGPMKGGQGRFMNRSAGPYGGGGGGAGNMGGFNNGNNFNNNRAGRGRGVGRGGANQ